MHGLAARQSGRPVLIEVLKKGLKSLSTVHLLSTCWHRGLKWIKRVPPLKNAWPSGESGGSGDDSLS